MYHFTSFHRLVWPGSFFRLCSPTIAIETKVARLACHSLEISHFRKRVISDFVQSSSWYRPASERLPGRPASCWCLCVSQLAALLQLEANKLTSSRRASCFLHLWRRWIFFPFVFLEKQINHCLCLTGQRPHSFFWSLSAFCLRWLVSHDVFKMLPQRLRD